MKNFREIYEELGKSRSTVQNWVYTFFDDKKQNKKDNTELVFTDAEVAKIWEIAYYKELDYTNDEIKKLLTSSQNDLRKTLDVKINELIEKKEHIERLISVSNFICDSGCKPASFKYALMDYKGIKYNTIEKSLYELVSDNFGCFEREKFSKRLKCIDIEYVLDCIDTIMLKRCKDVDYYEGEVQEDIRKIHESMYCFIGKSVLVFMGAGICIAPGNKFAFEIDEKYGAQSAEYLYKALSYYVESNIENEFDKKYFDIVEKLVQLSEEGYDAETKEAQEQVRNIYEFYNSCIPLSEFSNNKLFKVICNIFKEVDWRKIKNKRDYNGVKFIIDAIEYFCNTEQEV